MKNDVSSSLFKRACRVLPGGVNSPVRAFGAVGGAPRFIDHAKGQYMYDADDNKYIDYIGSWGPMILGHNDERVIEAGKKQIEKGRHLSESDAPFLTVRTARRAALPFFNPAPSGGDPPPSGACYRG